MKNLIPDITTTKKSKLGSVLEKLTQHHIRRKQVNLDDCDNKRCAFTQFLQIPKNQLSDLQDHWERYCGVLPVIGLKSEKHDLKEMKSYLLPTLVNDRDIEPAVIKKVKQFISFKFDNFQLLDKVNFLVGATSLVSFLKTYKETLSLRKVRQPWQIINLKRKTPRCEHPHTLYYLVKLPILIQYWTIPYLKQFRTIPYLNILPSYTIYYYFAEL